jgi:hypothetical protein
LAFDGSNISVINTGDNTVRKLRKSTGAIVKTYRVDFAPEDIPFDGISIWVACNASDTVNKINPRSP